nr:MAG TPA: hypothetical protein [Bacteriophage sp.]
MILSQNHTLAFMYLLTVKYLIFQHICYAASHFICT